MDSRDATYDPGHVDRRRGFVADGVTADDRHMWVGVDGSGLAA
jgi:hypothetical protein